MTRNITESLAKGLAHEAWKEWIQRIHSANARPFAPGYIESWKQRQKTLRGARAHFADVALGDYLIDSSSGLAYGVVIPAVHPGGIVLLARRLAVSRRAPRPVEWESALLEINEHALIRLYQRVGTFEHDRVEAELRSAILLVVPITEVARELGYRQLILPTTSGVLRCDLGTVPVARTWTPSSSIGRWASVERALRDAYAALLPSGTTEAQLEQRFCELVFTRDESALQEVKRALVAFDWLKEPYVKPDDPVGDVWTAARAAADGSPD